MKANTKKVTETVLAFHFRRADGTTNYLRTAETVGEWYEVSGEIIPCRNGLHASVNPIDALRYAKGLLVCRVECGGTIVHHKDGDKLAASRRRVLWQADATNTILLFIADCVDRQLQREREAGREPDARSWGATETIRKFVAGKATRAELDAAYAAAYAAADAAYAAAYAAYAARAAAYAAADAAAYAAEREWQADELTRRLLALAPDTEEATETAASEVAEEGAQSK